jgi:hypothetical protein
MKTFLILFVALWTFAGEPNLASFRTLNGMVYTNVVIVSTNADGIVFKVPGQSGWRKESFTNLPARFQVSAADRQRESETEERINYFRTNDFFVSYGNKLEEAIGKSDEEKLTIYTEAMEMLVKRNEAIGDAARDMDFRRVMDSAAASSAGRPSDQIVEKTKDLEEAQAWEDYRKDRINSAEYRARKLAIEKKYAAGYARMNEVSRMAEARVNAAYLKRVQQMKWESDELVVRLKTLALLVAKVKESIRSETATK